MSTAPSVAADAVLVKSEKVPDGSRAVAGVDFNANPSWLQLVGAFATTGFQGTHLSQAVTEIEKMLSWRLSDETDEETIELSYDTPPVPTRSVKAVKFLGVAANVMRTGVRESIAFLAQHVLIDVLVVSGGAMEYDLCLSLGTDYARVYGATASPPGEVGGNVATQPGSTRGILNRFLAPLFPEMVEKQRRHQATRDPADTCPAYWTPSRLWAFLGEHAPKDTVCYWAAKNGIPIYTPSFSDGDIAEVFLELMQGTDRLMFDLVQDIYFLNKTAMKAKKSGIVVLGGGVVKHHVCNANLMRNGADFAVFINDAEEYDGSDAGAKPDEAVSWGKLRLTSSPVKIYSEITLVFPLLVAAAFVPEAQRLMVATGSV